MLQSVGIACQKPTSVDQPLVVIGRPRGQRVADLLFELLYCRCGGEIGESQASNTDRRRHDLEVDQRRRILLRTRRGRTRPLFCHRVRIRLWSWRSGSEVQRRSEDAITGSGQFLSDGGVGGWDVRRSVGLRFKRTCMLSVPGTNCFHGFQRNSGPSSRDRGVSLPARQSSSRGCHRAEEQSTVVVDVVDNPLLSDC